MNLKISIIKEIITINNIIFENKTHKKKFTEFCNRLPERRKNPTSYAAMYLLALIGQGENDLFDFEKGLIEPEGINAGWQTSSTKKATALMFGMWNSRCMDAETSKVCNIFGSSYWDRYFLEALKIRYTETIDSPFARTYN